MSYVASAVSIGLLFVGFCLYFGVVVIANA